MGVSFFMTILSKFHNDPKTSFLYMIYAVYADQMAQVEFKLATFPMLLEYNILLILCNTWSWLRPYIIIHII